MNHRILHNSHLAEYRQPFGAVPCGMEITLQLDIEVASHVEYVGLHIHYDEGQTFEYPMSISPFNHDISRYRVTVVMPSQPQLGWYYFVIIENGYKYYYGNNHGRFGGVGDRYEDNPHAYQITIHDEAVETPQWFKESVMYQIFVDRFYNGNPNGLIDNPKKESLLHSHWENAPLYVRDPDTKRVVRWDFFGGNLLGVMKKLPYLQSLGIRVIYFNPIFEAASNHKYDTGDYHKIDPMFGDNDLFQELCIKAEQYGISIILDGVFSHTGSDSIYFNREGNYDSVGAYQSQKSPYYSWYKFSNYPDQYESWWGVDVLPNVEELDPYYQDFIIEQENSVLKQWIQLGAKGWRLDVADELPDSFIKKFWKTMKEFDKETILIGEVWEDASNKTSYGNRREYLLGQELDSVMNYPFRNAVIDFLMNRSDANKIHQQLMSLYENYPLHYFYSTMNLVGTHDSTRILTVLNDNIDKLKLAVIWQMTFPGVPCIYYGDETGVTGGEDPHNRKPFPWNDQNHELINWYKKIVAIRNHYDVFQTGSWQSIAPSNQVYGYIRTIENQQDVFGYKKLDNLAVVVMNSSDTQTVSVDIDTHQWMIEGFMYDLTDDVEFVVNEGRIRILLQPLQGRILIKNRWNRKESEKRRAGILLHPTSLPSKHGIGDLGEQAYAFVDFLAESGQNLWQMLPLHPVGYGESPYQSFSAFAGNPMLISLERLVEDGYLQAEDISDHPVFLDNIVDFEEVKQFKNKLLKKAFANFCESPSLTVLCPEFDLFCKEHQDWLDDYSLFMALKDHYNQIPWVDWDQNIAARESNAIDNYREKLQNRIQYEKFLQFLFFRQWNDLKNYANQKGVQIIGDLPIYIAHDSADVWVQQHLFKLDAQGHPTHVAGVPPDYFSETGQLWGNPIYQWDTLKAEGYQWWVKRIAALQKLVDRIRIDHFRGFADFWEIPAGEKTAINGQWVDGPGEEFFDKIYEQLGSVPFVAEDLGYLSPRVHELKEYTQLPGMQILQFEIEPNLLTKFHIPLHNKNTAVYTGTHDNDTVLSWYQRSHPIAAEDSTREEDKKIAWTFIEKVYQTDANIVIIPLQDILALGPEGRMNTPGTTTGNWSWRFTEGQINAKIKQKLKDLTIKYGR
ncbi:4-alpha-glucanotransferase [Desulfuribacillus stibiiarsenatis]|uniref:4-alpha-glucanotransferase n=1 Tax=Desulfuribacillus stibiiarsenatis TaxID=1390249 RepID=A0A1E5L3A6_9FIRM|nr:4-alpha-glucanotransferase [Desulfuribacillus stibiiarsenatis]OEH84618.1 4-alpha-glucanotransferase [Desulfuribacillus stibiiarsenatis]